MKHKILVLVLLLSACHGNRDSDLTKIKLKELNGQHIDLMMYEGKTLFINFWATWCKPCIQEMPTIEKLQEILNDEQIVFLLASNEDIDQIEKFRRRHSYNFHYVLLENMEALNIQALPTTFVFNPHGELMFSETGFRIWDSPENIDLVKKIMNDEK